MATCLCIASNAKQDLSYFCVRACCPFFGRYDPSGAGGIVFFCVYFLGCGLFLSVEGECLAVSQASGQWCGG